LRRAAFLRRPAAAPAARARAAATRPAARRRRPRVSERRPLPPDTSAPPAPTPCPRAAPDTPQTHPGSPPFQAPSALPLPSLPPRAQARVAPGAGAPRAARQVALLPQAAAPPFRRRPQAAGAPAAGHRFPLVAPTPPCAAAPRCRGRARSRSFSGPWARRSVRSPTEAAPFCSLAAAARRRVLDPLLHVHQSRPLLKPPPRPPEQAAGPRPPRRAPAPRGRRPAPRGAGGGRSGGGRRGARCSAARRALYSLPPATAPPFALTPLAPRAPRAHGPCLVVPIRCSLPSCGFAPRPAAAQSPRGRCSARPRPRRPGARPRRPRPCRAPPPRPPRFFAGVRPASGPPRASLWPPRRASRASSCRTSSCCCATAAAPPWLAQPGARCGARV
jgi:hypothetical protein